MNKVKVYNTDDIVEAELILDTLKNHGMNVELRQHSVGEYLNIFMGFSRYGIDILVDQENRNNAKEIIDEIVLQDNNIKIDKMRVPWFRNKRIVAGIILGFFLTGIIISLVNFVAVLFH